MARTTPCEVKGCDKPANLLEGAFGRGAFLKDKHDRCTEHWKTLKKAKG